MTGLKRLMAVMMITAAVAGAYFAGARTSSTHEAAKPVDDGILVVPSAKPADITIANPTAVLLGEAKVPDSLFSSPPPPARPDLIVPEIPK